MMITLAKLLWVLIAAYYGMIVPHVASDEHHECPTYEMTMMIHGLDPEVFSPIMYRESRCQSWQINEADPNGGSFGLLQINAIHLRDVEMHPDKWDGVERCKVESTGDLLIGWRNICFASYLYVRSGGTPWNL
jgi:hypothetical protein